MQLTALLMRTRLNASRGEIRHTCRSNAPVEETALVLAIDRRSISAVCTICPANTLVFHRFGQLSQHQQSVIGEPSQVRRCHHGQTLPDFGQCIGDTAVTDQLQEYGEVYVSVSGSSG